MDSAISFANGSQILALNSCDRLCYVIQPFIQEILNQFVQLNSLDQAIVIGAKSIIK